MPNGNFNRFVQTSIVSEEEMAGIILNSVFKATIGFLISKGRDLLAEKLKDGDVTDEKFRDWIVREIDAVNSKLDSIAWKDLGASINYFKEGIVLMYVVLEKSTTEEAMEIEEKANNNDVGLLITVRQNSISSPEGIKSTELTDPDKLSQKALSEAKKRFKDARKKATEAVSNKALRPTVRILAMEYLVSATILENADSPSIALPLCRYHLEELHSMAVVQKTFQERVKRSFKSRLSKNDRNEVISGVCRINHAVLAIAHMVGDHRSALLDWPCITIKEEKIDPVRDARIVNRLKKLQVNNEVPELPALYRTKEKSIGPFILLDIRNGETKTFDSDEDQFCSSVVSISVQATLKIQCVKPTAEQSRMSLLVDTTDARYLSNIQGVLSSIVLEKRGHRVLSVAVNNKTDQLAVLVEDVICTPSSFIDYSTPCEVEVYGSDGHFRNRFGREQLKDAIDITATSDGGFMVLQQNSCIYAFNADGSHYHQFRVSGNTCPRGAALFCFPPTDHVFVASLNAEHCLQVSIHSKGGTFERNIYIQHKEEKGMWCVSGMCVTKEARIAVAINDARGHKLLVV